MWKHNAYGDMIKEEGDFVGYVAYALYKEQKVKWIKNYHEKHEKFPSPEEILNFFTTYHSSPGCINKYRDDAERMLNEYFDFSFSEELDLYQEAVKEEAIVQAVHKPFTQSIKESVVAALISSAIIAVGSTIYWQNFQREEMENKIATMETMQKDLMEKLASHKISATQTSEE